ncbi:hypothetical protein [Streptomyces sp. AC627_RSS907]|uniref:hypothetical protein n=1 Tax=Streptomyces sp. AC627_RSS907 TaxID=2823684 RepID=UPI0020B6F2F3|nr:hypothetical protein [Streptomyces sp. AC627_RSS907]
MTLADPRKKDFSTIVVNDSDRPRTYRIKTENMRLGDPAMEVWETRGADPGQAYDANFKHLVDEIRPGPDGYYTYTVRPRSIVPLTTLEWPLVRPIPGRHRCGNGSGAAVPRQGRCAQGDDGLVVVAGTGTVGDQRPAQFTG